MDVLAALGDLLGNGVNIAWAILGLGLVIFLHELGHFAVAKWCNVHVERFSIGFGPIIFGWKQGETEYALSLIPFGGYVKMLGQDDSDPSQMTSEEIAADPRSYVAKNVWQRMAIISAGVTMNVLSAVVFFAVAFAFGREIEPPVIGTVLTGMPAWEAGIQRGDRITHFNGREVTNFRDLALNVAVSTGPIELRGYHRDGTQFATRVEPDASGTRPQIGIYPSLGLSLADDPGSKDSPALPGSAASRAQPPFERGDLVLKVGDHEVASFADFQDRLAARNGQPTQLTLRRKGSDAPIQVAIESNYFRTLGLRLDTGAIAAVQAGSPAEKAELKVGDKLAKINGRNVGTDIDPLRLPDEFAQLHGQTVDVTVARQNPNGGMGEVTVKLTPQDRAGWLEQPELEGEPVSIPAIGAAFHVVPFVLQVAPDSPAAQAGIQPNSSIQKIELVLPAGAPADGRDDRTFEIKLDDPTDPKKANNWGFAFWSMQELPQREVRLTIKQLDQPQPKTVTVVPQQDKSWPMPTLGLRMQLLMYEEKADGVAHAFTMAYTHSRNTILNIYLTLRSLVTQRLSYKELHGPVGIAQAAFVTASQGFVPFLLFLGFLSLNLAVLNFLPIPVLDGGHMVFLVWEAITRRRPSERVLIGATYAGMVFLLGLMGLVLFLDFSRLIGGGQ
jgi:regulator of sigma E protease